MFLLWTARQVNRNVADLPVCIIDPNYLDRLGKQLPASKRTASQLVRYPASSNHERLKVENHTLLFCLPRCHQQETPPFSYQLFPFLGGLVPITHTIRVSMSLSRSRLYRSPLAVKEQRKNQEMIMKLQKGALMVTAQSCGKCGSLVGRPLLDYRYYNKINI